MEAVLEGIDPSDTTRHLDGPLHLIYEPILSPSKKNPPRLGPVVALMIRQGDVTLAKNKSVRLVRVPENTKELKAVAGNLQKCLFECDRLGTYTAHGLLVSIIRNVFGVLPFVGRGEDLPDVPELLTCLCHSFQSEGKKLPDAVEEFSNVHLRVFNARELIVTRLLRRYRAAYPIKNVGSIVEWITESPPVDGCAEVELISKMWWQLAFQELVLNMILGDTIVNECPPCRDYRLDWVNTYISSIEEVNCEVHEGLLKEQYRLTLERKKSGNVHHHRSFTLPTESGQSVTVSVRSAQLLSNIASFVWPGAFVLAEYFLEKPELFRNKNVLELGSGTGFSASALLCTQPRKIVCTDYDRESLECLQYNFNINLKRYEGFFKAKDCRPVDVQIESLDWNDYDMKTVSTWSPDIIVGSDLVYSPDLVKPLIQLLEDCLLSTQAKGIILVFQIRNRNTWKLFLEYLDRRSKLQHHFLPLPKPVFERGETIGVDKIQDNEIKVIEITKRNSIFGEGHTRKTSSK